MRRLIMLIIIIVGLYSTQLWAAQQAVLLSIRMIGGTTGGQVEILANAPITYAYYKLDALQAVVDIAPATPSTSFRPDQLQADIFSSVSMETKELVNATATRLIFKLKEGASFAVQRSPEDKGRLLVSFTSAFLPQAAQAKPESLADKALNEEVPVKTDAVVSNAIDPSPKDSNQATPALREPAADDMAAAPGITPSPTAPTEPSTKREPVPVVGEAKDEPVAVTPVSQPTPSSKSESTTTLQPVVPATPATPPAVTAIKIGSDSIIIVTRGTVTKHHSFQLTKPRRLVIDIPGAMNGITAGPVPINRFGLGKTRVGTYPDKVRIVFDADKDIVPAYRIESSGEGIVVRFKNN